jgi:hypothetical protein
VAPVLVAMHLLEEDGIGARWSTPHQIEPA